jgi:hypothetical protein
MAVDEGSVDSPTMPALARDDARHHATDLVSVWHLSSVDAIANWARFTSTLSIELHQNRAQATTAGGCRLRQPSGSRQPKTGMQPFVEVAVSDLFLREGGWHEMIPPHHESDARYAEFLRARWELRRMRHRSHQGGANEDAKLGR